MIRIPQIFLLAIAFFAAASIKGAQSERLMELHMSVEIPFGEHFFFTGFYLEMWGNSVIFAEKKKNMDESRIYPIGQQNFRELRKQGALYVDKTSYLEKIVNNRTQYWFLARPRRFGKSLFLSTLEYFYKGERELFKGLFIDSVNWNWEKYPVFRLDLNVEKYKEPGILDKVLDLYFRKWEEEYGVTTVAKTLSGRFQSPPDRGG